MKRKNVSRNALFASIISLLLCVSMLVGTTFAWFTDEVKSGNNVIAAGNLDIEVEYSFDGQKWFDLKAASDLFSKELWEPGHTQVVYLKVSNEGTLALKYSLGINIIEETPGYSVEEAPFMLSDYIQMGVVDLGATAPAEYYKTREEAVKAVNDKSAFNAIKAGYSFSDKMVPAGKEATAELSAPVKYLAVVVNMPTTVGNEANYKTGTTPPSIDLGINVFATQQVHENDSFGPDYDKGAVWTGGVDTKWYDANKTEFTIVTAEELAGLAKIANSGVDTFKGKIVKLGADIDLNNVLWTPIGTKTNKFNGTFIGTGYMIRNLKAVGTTGVGLFGYTNSSTHIEGVTIDGAYVSGNDYVGAVLGSGYLSSNCIRNCTVTDATIIAAPYLMSDGKTYDGGAKAGVIAGYANNGHLIGNTAKNSEVFAYRDLGGIAGMASGENYKMNIEDNAVENVTLNYLGVAGVYNEGKSNGNMAELVGRPNNTKPDDNTVTNVTMNDANKGAFMIFTLDELIKFAKDVNAGNNYNGKTVILGADIDLLNMEWTPIGNSANTFQGTFDGNGKTISNLNVNMPGKSNAGFFGMTTNGAVKNLTVENATVIGRLNVGVVAGTPYTSKYSDITVKGLVKVEGMAYVGGVGGKNAYADWTNITVDVKEGSYVKANSVENGTAYRTYVGGVIGFMGEGGHKVTNVTSNIDVIGSTCDVGGIVGIAHYGNTFENITCTGDVSITNATEAGEAEEIGGIAGVWHNGQSAVTFTNCKFDGKLTANFTEGVDLTNNTITGKPYGETGDGKLYIDGVCVWPEFDKWDGTADTSWYNETVTEFTLDSGAQLAGLAALVENGNTFAGKTITLDRDIDLAKLPFNPIGHSKNGKSFNGTFDGQGHTISNMYEQSNLDDKNGGWQYEGEYYGLFAYTKGATIKNVTIADAYISSGRNEAAGVVGNAVDTTFSDITISNTTLIAYNNSAGGVAAECYGNCSFTNIVVDEDTVIGPLWGTYDVRLGGVVGLVQAGNNVTFSNVTVACQLDAINDVAANYQYWLYRYSGMLIGHVDGVNGVADPTGYVTCENVKVIYGDWVNYHYCEDAELGAGSYNGPGEYKYARVEAGTGTGGIDLSACNHNDDESHNVLIVFDQLFGGGQGVKGLKAYNGVTVIYNDK